VTRTIRLLGAALGAFVGLGLAAAGGGLFPNVPYSGAMVAAWTIAWLIVGFATLPYMTTVPAMWLISQVQQMSTTEFVASILGLFIGLLLGLLLGLPLAHLEGPLGTWLPVGISLFMGLGMTGLTVAKRMDLLAAAQNIGVVRKPSAESTSGDGIPQIVVDTSVLIDGRIADIIESGFIVGTLIVGRFVIEEMQHIADSSDTVRRNRGRRGLEILSRIQKGERNAVEIVDDEAPTIAEVDAKLVDMARRRSRLILTNDFNLNRVAELQGVRVMNVNLLANAVKPALLPGEELRVKVTSAGKEQGQGVGFLDDGTMVVIENGARLVDRDVDVTVTRVLQTVAGRMIFAQPRSG